ncbi:MAG: acyl carrier protein [bacterium]|nr:acyl carrier protein [bacterium]
MLTVKHIEETLIQEIATILDVDSSTISSNAPLHTLGVDSFSFVELLVFIEKTFNLKLMESGLTRENSQTIHLLASYISRMS